MGLLLSKPPPQPTDGEFFAKVCAHAGLPFTAIEKLKFKYLTRLAFYRAIDKGGPDVPGLDEQQISMARRAAIAMRDNFYRLGKK